MGDDEDDDGMFDDEDMDEEDSDDGEDMDDVDGMKDEEILAAMREMDAQLAECQAEEIPDSDKAGPSAPGLEHVDPKNPGLDMHVMKHLLESYCAEHKMDPGPTSLLFDQLKK